MKKRLPAMRNTPPDFAARVRLAAWLREWSIERALETEEDARAPFAPSPGAGRRRAAQAGQVRLMRPDTPAGRMRPRYLLVLDVNSERSLAHIAPFSRFRAPALPGEWRTGHPAAPLSVLCFWNRRELPLDWVERSWPVTVFEPERLGAARKAAAVVVAPDVAPPVEQADAVGPPLRLPADPRWRYLREEAEAWDSAVEIGSAAASKAYILENHADAFGGRSESALPLAAEPKPRYGKPPRASRRDSNKTE